MLGRLATWSEDTRDSTGSGHVREPVESATRTVTGAGLDAVDAG